MNEKKSRAWKHQDEVARLYTEEKETLREIGSKFGCSRETIRTILRGLNVPKNPRKRGPRKTVDAEKVRRMYVEEKLPIKTIARKMKARQTTITTALKSLGIHIHQGGYYSIAYPELRWLKVGESLDLPRIVTTHKTHFTRYYDMAKNAGIKVSIKTIDDKTMRVTRKAWL